MEQLLLWHQLKKLGIRKLERSRGWGKGSAVVSLRLPEGSAAVSARSKRQIDCADEHHER